MPLLLKEPELQEMVEVAHDTRGILAGAMMMMVVVLMVVLMLMAAAVWVGGEPES